MNCKICGKPLHAFHYYRDNCCWTYCEQCGKPNHACYASPYKTIELMFSGIQEEGVILSVEVANWPYLERCSLRWYEWCRFGGYDKTIDLPINYMLEHTVDNFIDEYILKDNMVTEHIPNVNDVEFLNKIRIILSESGVFQK